MNNTNKKERTIEERTIEESTIEESIRQPDKVIKEILIDDDNIHDSTWETYDNNLERTIHLSMLEFTNKEELDIMRVISLETKMVMQKFTTIKDKIEKINKLDKANSEIYELILTYIELHNITYNLHYELECDTYEKCIKCITLMRFTTEEKQLLQELLIKE